MLLFQALDQRADALRGIVEGVRQLPYFIVRSVLDACMVISMRQFMAAVDQITQRRNDAGANQNEQDRQHQNIDQKNQINRIERPRLLTLRIQRQRLHQLLGAPEHGCGSDGDLAELRCIHGG